MTPLNGMSLLLEDVPSNSQICSHGLFVKQVQDPLEVEGVKGETQKGDWMTN